MSRSDLRIGKGMLAGYAVVIAMVAILGVRSNRTVAAVLAPDWSRETPAIATAADTVAAEVVRRDVALLEALPGERDPFADPPVERRAAPAPRTRVTRPREPAPPTLQAIIHDETGTMVRLQSGREASDWLREGDQFGGWTIERISADTVRLTRNGKHHEIKAY